MEGNRRCRGYLAHPKLWAWRLYAAHVQNVKIMPKCIGYQKAGKVDKMIIVHCELRAPYVMCPRWSGS